MASWFPLRGPLEVVINEKPIIRLDRGAFDDSVRWLASVCGFYHVIDATPELAYLRLVIYLRTKGIELAPPHQRYNPRQKGTPL